MDTDFRLEELELFTELSTFVAIIPNFKEDELYLLSGKIGDFKPNHEIEVPLWLALLFKKQQKCKIIPPFWMKEDTLKEWYAQQSLAEELINLQNPEFFEISYIMLNRASDDLANPYKLRNLVDSIRDVREVNILKKLRVNHGCLLNNATTYELNKFRKAKGLVMNQLAVLNNIKPTPQ